MKNYKLAVFTIAITIASSCKKFIEIENPIDKITSEKVFTNDQTATSALLGIYSMMLSSTGSIPIISTGAMTIYTGLSSDELQYTGTVVNEIEFANNSIGITNGIINSDLWRWAYSFIYQSNAVIEGLQKSSGLSMQVVHQLMGEAKFLRAFLYFYLVNSFGNVPLIVSSDYRENAEKPRATVEQVYLQITADLEESIGLLDADYPSPGRARVNKWVASALLARVTLYTLNWAQSETLSTVVINSGAYKLLTNLNNVFLANSNESLWQLIPNLSGTLNTVEGNKFIPTSSATVRPSYPLTSQLLNSFEAGDMRKTNWTNSKVVSGQTYYYPFKYKIRSNATITEYYTMMRFSEQFLIRAESRARQNNLIGAISDLNIIRQRAGLSPLATTVNQAEVFSAIERERKSELFAEWGHRWFDLKRTGTANAVLSSLKTGWQATDTLFPIPQSQILLNPALTQNTGY